MTIVDNNPDEGNDPQMRRDLEQAFDFDLHDQLLQIRPGVCKAIDTLIRLDYKEPDLELALVRAQVQNESTGTAQAIVMHDMIMSYFRVEYNRLEALAILN